MPFFESSDQAPDRLLDQARVRRACLALTALAALVQAAMQIWTSDAEIRLAHTSFLTLHLLFELFAIIVATLIVVGSWHAAAIRPLRPGVVAIGGFLVVALCDTVHALTYEGMPDFLGVGAGQRAIFFWLMGRTAELLTILLMAVPLQLRISRRQSLGAGLLVAAFILIWGLVRLDWFPTTFVPGQGLTPFKAGYELVICAANLLLGAYWWRRAGRERNPRFHIVATSCWIIGVGALSFVSYEAPSDFNNIIGHVFKVTGYSLLYGVAFIANVRLPLVVMAQAQARAAEEESRLHALSDNLPRTMVFQVVEQPDGSRRFAYVSHAVERLLGVPAAEILTSSDALRCCVHPDDRPIIDGALAQGAGRAGAFDVTVRAVHRGDGGMRWMEMAAAPRPQPDGRILWDGVATDVTEAHIAELRRRENEAMLEAVIRTASDAIISTDAEGRVTLFNPAAERIFGHAEVTMLGQPLDRLLPSDKVARHRAGLTAFAGIGEVSRPLGLGRVQGLRADGAMLELEASVSHVTVSGRQVFTAILRDVTDRMRNERALVQSQIELTELTHRLMEQEKETSRRLAQALHDQLGQTLTAMRLDFVGEATFADPSQARRHARVDRLIDQAMGEVRQVLVDLRPTLLDEQGLVEALHNEMDTRQRAVEDVRLRLDVAPGLAAQRWSADVEYAAFMVAREALANALQHAAASQIDVIVSGDARRLCLQVRDDGIGLGPTSRSSPPGHLGMVGMRERSIAIGARFEVSSPPEGGTAVTLIWDDPRP